MTGGFARCPRPSLCVSFGCDTKIPVGAWVYLFMHSDRQTVCVECAKRRWHYAPPEDSPAVLLPSPSKALSFATFDRTAAGGELRRNILTRRELDQVNASDPKLKALGER